ncbi:MAG: nucleotidyltransferase domain-containing protein [Flavobacteriia bacterium]|nr:nucleotidyltransferase domain-containing protein [Flavobacteriia bacterium]
MLSPKQIAIIKSITSRLNPLFVGVYGSYARGEEKPDSDLDVLIDVRNKTNLLDLIEIEQELTQELNLKVDLITYRSLNSLIKPYIEKDLILL